MLRFIRRVFMLLVLFTIVFLIYRYINPISANNFIKKLKTIPNNIVNMFSLQNELIITDTTIGITGDLNSGFNLGLNSGDQNIEEKENDLWLEELNQEIESILGKSQVSTGETDNNLENKNKVCVLEGGIIDVSLDNTTSCCDGLREFIRPEISIQNVDSVGGNICYDYNKGDVVCDHIGTDSEGRYYTDGELLLLNDFCDGLYNVVKKDESLPIKVNHKEGLSANDYEQIEDVFGNLVE